MAIEKFIHGKRDSCKHEGLASTRRREQEADYELKLYLEGEEVIIYERSTNSISAGALLPNRVDKLERGENLG